MQTLFIPTAYFPNVEYFHRLLNHRSVKICLNERFPKQTYRNRCELLNANGTQSLTVPVSREQGFETLTKDVEISYAENWAKQHLKSIESAYRRTPYYEYYIDQLANSINKNHRFIWQLNHEILVFLIDKIGLSCEVEIDFEGDKSTDESMQLVNPKSTSNFRTASYIQTFSERYGFVNNLSAIDLLFNEGPNSICILQESNS